MIKPFLANDAFLADVHSVAGDRDTLYLWWLGQSGYLVQWNREYLLLDPYLSDSLTEKYANTDNPHVRLTERVIAPERLDFIHVVTSSHNHTDHLDAATLRPLLQVNPHLTIIVPEANLNFAAERLQVNSGRLTGITVETSLVVGEFVFHAIPAAHESIEQDIYGRHKYLGYIIEAGPWTIYHSGDTVWDDEVIEWLEAWPIDVALLPINGRVTKPGIAGNLTGAEAARLAHEVGARLVIPCHYDMFAFNTASPDEFMATAQQLNQPYIVLRAGERWSSDRLAHVGINAL
jgi:L-ascorbate metabolism protein UlaG (beta-lactamase superfamily)